MINYSEDQERQYHIQVAKGEVGRYVILPGDPKRCQKIAAHFDEPKLIADNREYVTYTGYLDGEKVSVTSTGIGGPSASIAMEELKRVGADTFIRVGTSGGMALLVKAAGKLEFPCHTGVVQCKDAFYGQHDPMSMPVGYELMNKWDAWMKCGCLASEMESAAIFIVGSTLRVRTGTVLLVMANQERAKQGLSNPVVHDTDAPIRTAIEAIRALIREDRESGKTLL